MPLYELQLGLAHVMRDIEALERQARAECRYAIAASLVDARLSVQEAKLGSLACQQAAELHDGVAPAAWRKCAACEAPFQVTPERQMLCAECFKSGEPPLLPAHELSGE